MTGKSIANQSPHVSRTAPIAIESSVGEEKGKEVSQLGFAQRVEALTDHDRKAIRRYLSKSPEKSSKQREMLGKAIRDNNLEAVKVLLECGVNVNRYDWRGVTPLFEACECVHVEIVEILLIKGADPNVLNREGNQWAPLHLCIALDKKSKRESCLTCAKLLLDHGADVNRKTHIVEDTPLHFVKADKQPEWVALLLGRGGDPLAKNYEDDLPKLRLRNLQGLGPHITTALQIGKREYVDCWITAVENFLPGPAAATLLAKWARLCIQDEELSKRIHQPRYFQGLGPHITTALQTGKRRQVDRWITAVKNCLPDPEAAALLAEWAPLCIQDVKLSKRIHTGIERFLKKFNGDPPPAVVRYVTGHNAREMREEVVAKLAAAKLRPAGIRENFSVIGYSSADHGLLLIELARVLGTRSGRRSHTPCNCDPEIHCIKAKGHTEAGSHRAAQCRRQAARGAAQKRCPGACRASLVYPGLPWQGAIRPA